MFQYKRLFIGLVCLSVALYTSSFLIHLHSRVSTRSVSNGCGNSEDLEILSSSTIAQDDPRLVAIVRRMLIPPSQKPYNFTNRDLNEKSNYDPSAGQSQAVKDILTGFRSAGFFIECGANDGEWKTNTLWVERNLGWNGVLIEADSRPLKSLLTKNRKASVGNFCLPNTPHPQIVPFYLHEFKKGLGSGLIRSAHYRATKSVSTQCIPLYTVGVADTDT